MTTRFLISAALSVLFIATPIVPLRRSGSRIFDSPGPVRPIRDVLVSFVVFIHLLIVLFIVGLLLLLLGPADGPGERTIESIAFWGEPWVLWTFGLGACLWAPLFEEIAFRRFLYRAFRGRWGGTRAALASSAIFAVVHPYGTAGQISVFIVGLFLCGLYEFRKSLLAPMALHAMINALFMAFLLVSVQNLASAPSLGVAFAKGTDEVTIGEVLDGFPAEDAGLRPGDVITRVGEYGIEERIHVQRALATYKVGQTITVFIERDGVALEVDVVLNRTASERREAEVNRKLP